MPPALFHSLRDSCRWGGKILDHSSGAMPPSQTFEAGFPDPNFLTILGASQRRLQPEKNMSAQREKIKHALGLILLWSVCTAVIAAQTDYQPTPENLQARREFQRSEERRVGKE